MVALPCKISVTFVPPNILGIFQTFAKCAHCSQYTCSMHVQKEILHISKTNLALIFKKKEENHKICHVLQLHIRVKVISVDANCWICRDFCILVPSRVHTFYNWLLPLHCKHKHFIIHPLTWLEAYYTACIQTIFDGIIRGRCVVLTVITSTIRQGDKQKLAFMHHARLFDMFVHIQFALHWVIYCHTNCTTLASATSSGIYTVFIQTISTSLHTSNNAHLPGMH